MVLWPGIEIVIIVTKPGTAQLGAEKTKTGALSGILSLVICPVVF